MLRFFLPYIPVAPSTVDIAAAAGANMIVAGSAIFKHVSPREVMDQLRDNVQKHLDAARR